MRPSGADGNADGWETGKLGGEGVVDGGAVGGGAVGGGVVAGDGILPGAVTDGERGGGKTLGGIMTPGTTPGRAAGVDTVSANPTWQANCVKITTLHPVTLTTFATLPVYFFMFPWFQLR